jgi:carbon-monoxide dehydrogenase medium subunit
MVADPMTLWKHYHIANSVADALKVLSEAPGEAQIIAGGTDLLLDIQQGRHPLVHTLVDVNEIQEMKAIEVRGEELFIGAAVPHKKINASNLVNEHCRALSIASGMIGGPQVRNTATIGGNIAHALPAADGTIALMALDASAVVANHSGYRKVPIASLFKGPGISSLDKINEILVGFYVGLKKPGQCSGFRRIMRPQGVAIAILNMAVWISRDRDHVDDVRIAVGPSGPVPRRMSQTEKSLREKTLTKDAIQNSYGYLLNEAQFRTSKYRATKLYREKMAGVLLES